MVASPRHHPGHGAGLDIASDTTALAVRVDRDGRGCVVGVSGELDVSNCVTLRTALDEEAAAGRDRLVIDLRDLAFCDSTGVGVLVRAHNAARETETEFAVICPDGPVRKVLRITGLVDVLHVVDTPDQAASLPGRDP
jgi:anti-sigma B factor antagonist